MDGKNLMQRMAKGQRIYGTLITSTMPAWLPKIPDIGLDFVFIDTEHMPVDRAMLSSLCHNYNALGIAPLVRIPSPDPFEACKALDAGASGILGPYIESAAQVRQLAGAVKYRPLKGKRLDDLLNGKLNLSAGETEFFKRYNEGRFLLANIESVEAINNLDEILSVQELDGIVIGPHDLSISLGIPEQYGDKAFDEAVCLIIRKALEHGKAVGNHFSFGIEHELRWAKEGMNIILHSIDYAVFISAMRGELNQFRKILGEPLFTPGGGIAAV